MADALSSRRQSVLPTGSCQLHLVLNGCLPLVCLPHILVQVLHPERSPAYVAPFGVEERQTVLAAFAAVSQAQRECMCCNPVL